MVLGLHLVVGGHLVDTNSIYTPSGLHILVGSTVVGRHDLIEGQVQYIIRNPIIKNYTLKLGGILHHPIKCMVRMDLLMETILLCRVDLLMETIPLQLAPFCW